MTTINEITAALRGIDMSKLSPQDKLTLLGVISVLDDSEPDDEGWIECNGQPDLPPKTYIIIRTRDGYINDSPETVEFWATGYNINNWTIDDTGRIVAYRVVK